MQTHVEKRTSVATFIARSLAAIGPGLFLIGYNVGTGSIVTMSKAGANYGMTLFWAVTLSCVFTFVLMVAYGQLTIVTGRTALANYRRHIPAGIGTALAVYVMAALILGELLALIGIFGIVSDLLSEGTRLLFGHGVHTIWLTMLLVAALYWLFWTGAYRTFERFLTVCVIFMTLCFVVVFFLVDPDYGAIIRGLVPRIPRVDGAMGLVAAMAGTTCSAAVFIIRSIVVAEKGWKVGDLRQEKRDAAVSAAMMLLLSGTVMAVAAGTLYVQGLTLDDSVELIRLFEPLGGRVAALILILGVAAAGISTVFPIALIAPWLIADFTGQPRDLQSPLFRVLGLGALLLAFVTQFLEQRPPAIMIFSQAFQAFILPAVVIPILYLLNRRPLMGEHRAKTWMNLGLVATLLFSLLTASLGVAELARMFLR